MRPLLLCAALLAPLLASAVEFPQPGLAYYFGEGAAFDPAVPAPAAVLGFEVGTRHLHHHEVVHYLTVLAEKSPRVRLAEYARSHGGKPLVLLALSTPANLARLDAIKQASRDLADPAKSAGVKLEEQPVIVNLSYSIHGNEPSGVNASVLMAYYLAASQDPAVAAALAQTVVLLDPALNPDGIERFAQWAGDTSGKVVNPDPATREHNEPWPQGRTNYYGFDLNRDYLPLSQPESQGRVEQFYAWRPNLYIDVHEMGTNLTFFLQPGEPLRVHPLIPENNQKLTRRLADFTSAALDGLGSLHYTRERFDDYYIGKGSTFTDLQGAVGILFEQASSRGLAQENDWGGVTLPFTIRNQLHATMAMFRGGHALRAELLAHKRQFYADALAEGRAAGAAAWIFACPDDPARLHAFARLLQAHQATVLALKEEVSANGQTFQPGEAVAVPLAQPAYRFLKAALERRTEFRDSVFYDISTWSLPLAFGLAEAELPKARAGALGGSWTPPLPGAYYTHEPAKVGYFFKWADYRAPRLLSELQRAGLRVYAVTENLRPVTAGQPGSAVAPGDLYLPVSPQGALADKAHDLALRVARTLDVRVVKADAGLAAAGVDLGSPTFRLIPQQKIALVGGAGTSVTSFGPVWHLFDAVQGVPLSVLEARDLDRIDLSRYTGLILPPGTYTSVSDDGAARLKAWVENGGTLVVLGTAARWVARAELAPVKFREPKPNFPARPAFAEAEVLSGQQLLAGAIFDTLADATHPLAWGYGRDRLPVFWAQKLFFEPAPDRYQTPLLIPAEGALLSGYSSAENLAAAGGSAAATVFPRRRGTVVVLGFEPAFRAFWMGTERVLWNALTFAPLMRPSGASSDDAE